MSIGWNWDNSYARLPGAFFARVAPARARAPKTAIFNDELAGELGLDVSSATSDELARLFAGQSVPDGAEPIAQAYAGHQFGGFNFLGDGRALLLGEHVAPSGARFDLQFKGSGPTPYSRRGDGLAALGPMLREYVVSEAMFALGVPTTRSLAVVETGERVQRETVKRGAVLTRVAKSHIRVGTFQFAAAKGDISLLRALADHTIARHDPNLAASPEPYAAFLRAVIERQAKLIARWQSIGFVHGVMNTDNMAISGETIDYGPCAFLDTYHPGAVFSSIDDGGRYAFGNQPAIAHWNLTRFAETLVPLLDPVEEKAVEIAVDALNLFPDAFERGYLSEMRNKLGLSTEDDDISLIQGLLSWMQTSEADFTNTFRALSSPDLLAAPRFRTTEFLAWHARLLARRERDGVEETAAHARMESANPDIIPRNHLVEAALAAAETDDDFGPLHELLAVLKTPFACDTAPEKYREPSPDPFAYRTFCGT